MTLAFVIVYSMLNLLLCRFPSKEDGTLYLLSCWSETDLVGDFWSQWTCNYCLLPCNSIWRIIPFSLNSEIFRVSYSLLKRFLYFKFYSKITEHLLNCNIYLIASTVAHTWARDTFRLHQFPFSSVFEIKRSFTQCRFCSHNLNRV